MGSALYGAVLISVCAQILLCCFSNDARGIGRYVRAVFSVCVLCLLLMPIYQTFTAIGMYQDEVGFDMSTDQTTGNLTAEMGETMVIEQTVKTLKQAVMQSVAVQFSIPVECIDATIVIDAKDHSAVTITHISVQLKGEAYGILTEKIERYLEEKFMTECEVMVL